MKTRVVLVYTDFNKNCVVKSNNKINEKKNYKNK